MRFMELSRKIKAIRDVLIAKDHYVQIGVDDGSRWKCESLWIKGTEVPGEFVGAVFYMNASCSLSEITYDRERDVLVVSSVKESNAGMQCVYKLPMEW